MKFKLPRGFKTFAKAHAKRVKARAQSERDPLNYYLEETGEYSGLKVHEDPNGKFYLEIYDSIGWWITEQDVSAALRNFEGDECEVRINCGGGDVFIGLTIAAILANHPAKFTARIEGMCASIATAICLGCDEVEMVTGSQFMVHSAWIVWGGNATEMREIADWLDKTTAGIVDVYEERTDLPREEIEELVAAETFLSAAEAVEKGFAARTVPLSKPKDEPEGSPENSEKKKVKAKAKKKASAKKTEKKEAEEKLALARVRRMREAEALALGAS